MSVMAISHASADGPPPVATMTAARAHRGEHRLHLERVPVPELVAGEALVAVRAAGVSRGLVGVWRYTDRLSLPMTLGHEVAGVVHAVAGGAATSGGTGVYRVGDRVRVHGPLGCGDCRSCRQGDETSCPLLSVIGYGSFGRPSSASERYRDGGLAPYVRVPVGNLDVLPDDVDFSLGCKLGTVAASLRGLRVARSRADGSGPLLVTGATGAAGSAAVACAPAAGFHEVVAVASRPGPLARLRTRHPSVIGVVATDELQQDWQDRHDLRDAVLGLTDGHGPAAVLDFTPLGPHVAAQCLRSLPRGGCLVAMAGNPSPPGVALVEVMAGGWQIVGSAGAGHADVSDLLGLLATRSVRLDGLVTHRFGLAEVNAAVDAVMDRTGEPVFVVIDDLRADPAAAGSSRTSDPPGGQPAAHEHQDRESRMECPQDVFDANAAQLAAEPDRVADLTATYQFDISGDAGGSWTMQVDDGQPTFRLGAAVAPDVVVSMSSGDFVDMGSGRLAGQTAFMEGKMRVKGDIGLAIRLADVFG